MQLLWEEYRKKYSDGYSRSRFFDLYRIWKGTIDPVMRIEHKAGDKLFVDYSGQTVAVMDPEKYRAHHAAYDRGVLGISPDYDVAIREDVLQEIDGPMLKHGLVEMHGTRIILPRQRSN